MIFIFFADRDPDGWEDEEPEGKLADMAKVRSELAAGDLRLVYLGWLLALQTDLSEVDDEDIEPPGAAGLGNLSASLQAIVDFLGIGEDLIAVAAGPAPTPAVPCPAGPATCSATCPRSRWRWPPTCWPRRR